MKRSKINIDAAKVAALKPEAKPFYVWDRNLDGFGVKVNPSGSKSYVLRYRTEDSKGSKIVRLANTKSVKAKDARKLAADRLVEIAAGADPVAERQERKQEHRDSRTLADVGREYIARCKKKGRSETTIRDYEHYVRVMENDNSERMPIPIGEMKIVEIERKHIVRFQEETVENRGTTTNRCVTLIGSIIGYAMDLGYIEHGFIPTARLGKIKKEKVIDRRISPAEYQKIGAVLREYEKTDPIRANYFRFLIFTGLRGKEARGLSWTDVDFDRSVIQLPDTKTGDRVDVPISSFALATLRSVRKWAMPDVPAVFPASARQAKNTKNPNGSISNPNSQWNVIVARAGITERTRIHDLRHGVASLGVQSGEGLPLVGSMLGHKSTETTARYAHHATEPTRQFAERMGEKLDGFLTADESEIDETAAN